MKYKQRARHPFEYANANLIFHTQKPAERWCFPRAHLVHAAAGVERLEFRFPLYHVVVKLAPTEPAQAAEAQLQEVLSGEVSVFEEVVAPTTHSEAGEYPPVRATKIEIESLQEDLY